MSASSSLPLFDGQNVDNEFGGPVSLANDGSFSHVGNPSDLMSPAIDYGVRRTISDEDLAILQDVGLPIATARDDFVTLTTGATFSAYAGNDSIGGSNAADVIYGNLGDDVLNLNAGGDRGYGGQGNDTVSGGFGNDIIFGNLGNDALYGNQDADILYGNQGNDVLYGGQGNDYLYGGQGSDTLIGGVGNDTLVGGVGPDLYAFGAGNGADLILGFSQSDGDSLDLGGQTYTEAGDGQNGTMLTLSGGGTVDLMGVAPQTLTSSAFA